MHRLLATSAIALLAGCVSRPLGECDEAAALELVYARDGTPAFAGQALIVGSCGAGGFCHSEGIAAADRSGAPAGLDFDLRLASNTNEVEPEQTTRLLRHQQRLIRMRGTIWESVVSGRMPPSGAAGEAYFASVDATYERVADDGVTTTPLPGVETDEGREILRNWLACRAPVVERGVDRIDGEPNVAGFSISPCERTCVDATWPEIRAGMLDRGCATGRCHGAETAAAELDLSGTDGEVHARILDAAPQGELCEGAAPILTASQPSASLLWLKVGGEAAAVCGAPMPLSGNAVSEQRRCALRVWIECGACPEADGGACAECVAMRRAECGIDLAMPSRCATVSQCPSRASPGL